MSGYVSFRLEGRGVDDVAFVLGREDLSTNGDLETSFFDGITQLRRHAAPGFPAAISAAAALPGTRIAAVIRNPSLVLDVHLIARVATAVATLPADLDWALAGAGGLGPDGRRHLALYASANPAIPETGGPQPVVDVMPDLYLIDAEFLRQILGEATTLPDAGAEPYLAVRGHLSGRASLFLPQLRAGIDGHLMERDLDRMSAELHALLWMHAPGQLVPTLSGDVQLEDPACAATPPLGQSLSDRVRALTHAGACAPGLSIVTRTRFERPGLLRRLLASISRARRDEIELEVVLASDAPEETCAEAVSKLRDDFLNLDIRLVRTTDREAPSRIANLLSGIAAARHDYVAIIDDDDYVDLFAFESLLPAFFCGNRPLIVTASQTHEESWERTPTGRDVLVQSQPRHAYPADGWRRMFSGVNRLPISAVIAPRARLSERIAAFPFRHDLSEDYALFLLLLTDPQLPPIHEIAETFCHISLRGTENSVTMPDRRPWVRDITAYLADLTCDPAIAAPGLWPLLTSGDAPDEAAGAATIGELRSTLARRETDLRLLRRENELLRGQLGQEAQSA